MYKSRFREYNLDTWSLGDNIGEGTELIIEEKYREYNRESVAITVSYTYNKTYDPIYAKLEEA